MSSTLLEKNISWAPLPLGYARANNFRFYIKPKVVAPHDYPPVNVSPVDVGDRHGHRLARLVDDVGRHLVVIYEELRLLDEHLLRPVVEPDHLCVRVCVLWFEARCSSSRKLNQVERSRLHSYMRLY